MKPRGLAILLLLAPALARAEEAGAEAGSAGGNSAHAVVGWGYYELLHVGLSARVGKRSTVAILAGSNLGTDGKTKLERRLQLRPRRRARPVWDVQFGWKVEALFWTQSDPDYDWKLLSLPFGVTAVRPLTHRALGRARRRGRLHHHPGLRPEAGRHLLQPTPMERQRMRRAPGIASGAGEGGGRAGGAGRAAARRRPAPSSRRCRTTRWRPSRPAPSCTAAPATSPASTRTPWRRSSTARPSSTAPSSTSSSARTTPSGWGTTTRCSTAPAPPSAASRT